MLLRKLALAALLVAVTTGCGPLLSLHSLYTGADLVLEPGLTGTWKATDEGVWTFQPSQDTGYLLKVVEKSGESSQYAAHLVRLGERLFMDVEPDAAPDTAIPGHFFVRLRLAGDTLRVAVLDGEWLKDKLGEGVYLPHEYIRTGKRKGDIVLTAPAPQLQLFLAHYAEDSKAFAEETELRRQR